MTTAEPPPIMAEDVTNYGIAAALLRHFNPDPSQGPCLFKTNDGFFLHWQGNRWVRLSHTDLLNQVVTDPLVRHRLQTVEGTAVTLRRIDVTTSRRTNVGISLVSLIPTLSHSPAWNENVHPPEYPNPSSIVSFRNILIDLDATAARFHETGEYQWATLPKTPAWIGTPDLTVDFDPDAPSPVWDRVTSEWSAGEGEVWVELLERYFGACISSNRDWGKFLLMYGTRRSGKGTCTKVLSTLLGGRPSFHGTQVSRITDDRQSGAGCHADVLQLSEIGDLNWEQKSKLAEELRVIVGRDPVEMNVKYGGILPVTYHCMPIIQTHNILRLPNEQGGLFSKMLPLRYSACFETKQDFNLFAKLTAELPGIALRFLKALVRLWAADAEHRWPLTKGSTELKRRIEAESNPIDAFLNWGFIPSVHPQSFVSFSDIRRSRFRYEQELGLKIRSRHNNLPISDRKLFDEIEEHSSWRLKKVTRKYYDMDEGAQCEGPGFSGMAFDLRTNKNS
jgi:hypothetical protein